MKVQKNNLRLRLVNCSDILSRIQEVLYPFELQLFSNHINVYFLQNNNSVGMKVITDWKVYELILFNILQNAVKYNKIEGDIIIAINIFPLLSQIPDF